MSTIDSMEMTTVAVEHKPMIRGLRAAIWFAFHVLAVLVLADHVDPGRNVLGQYSMGYAAGLLCLAAIGIIGTFIVYDLDDSTPPGWLYALGSYFLFSLTVIFIAPVAIPLHWLSLS